MTFSSASAKTFVGVTMVLLICMCCTIFVFSRRYSTSFRDEILKEKIQITLTFVSDGLNFSRYDEFSVFYYYFNQLHRIPSLFPLFSCLARFLSSNSISMPLFWRLLSGLCGDQKWLPLLYFFNQSLPGCTILIHFFYQFQHDWWVVSLLDDWQFFSAVINDIPMISNILRRRFNRWLLFVLKYLEILVISVEFFFREKNVQFRGRRFLVLCPAIAHDQPTLLQSR